MKIQQIALVCLLALSNGIGAAQVLHHPDSIYTFTDPHMQKSIRGVLLPKQSA